MNQEKVGKFIFELRKSVGLTQEQLAEKLGVTDKSISRWENGKTLPDYSLLNDLCNILNISINELFAGEKISEKEYKNKADDNLKLILKSKEENKKKLEKRLTITLTITTLFTMLAIFLIQLNSIRNVAIFVIILILAFLSNTINIIALALNNNS